uniref:Diphthine--ammonia ligase n=1 Tax=Kalanchoe fedtschenkoi TaxID=63787 RepID=A0A7N1A6F3_KALFE
MDVVGLVSGGKDSCYAMMKCVQYGHKIVALANLMPDDNLVDELDSYMYQTVGHQIIVCYAECMGVPLFRRRIRGTTRHQNLSYRLTPGDEVEDMFILLSEVKRQIPSIAAVSSGAIASDYQRLRVESICSRLGLVSLAYLWKQDQSFLLSEMISNKIVAIIVKVAALGLDPAKHLGKEIAELNPYLHKLKELYGINVCGEGGEYETLTLDCPLFTGARIMLTNFEVILHSSGVIAPVGILHPSGFHLIKKDDSVPLSNRTSSVFEVVNDCSPEAEDASQPVVISNSVHLSDCKLRISGTGNDSVFSICCWLTDGCQSSADLQSDLEVVLQKIDSVLLERGCGWESVLYIHLYIADMKAFSSANQMYVKYITQDKCPFGVPSRSTIELPLSKVGLGKAYVEALVTTDKSKQVLHVQSISCWAPSCIGPYSQATLHNNIIYMAGQLGLDPPTMVLCSGGLSGEMEQALENSEAIAKSFKCSVSSSAILFVVYCSKEIPALERTKIQEKMDDFLKRNRAANFSKHTRYLDPIFVYVLVPDLPKQALVEVKPVLYVSGNDAMMSDTEDPHTIEPNEWGFQHESWHDSGIQKCIVKGSVCSVILSITDQLATKLCSQSGNQNIEMSGDDQSALQMENIAKFAIYKLGNLLWENNFFWDDVTTLRVYVPISSILIPMEKLSLIFNHAFEEFSQTSQRTKYTKADAVVNLVPVMGSGGSAVAMNDMITCELFAQKLANHL